MNRMNPKVNPVGDRPFDSTHRFAAVAHGTIVLDHRGACVKYFSMCQWGLALLEARVAPRALTARCRNKYWNL